MGTITHQDGPITQVAGSSSTEESRSGGESIPLYSLLTGPQDEHHFAIDITCLGDVDGDGNDDMVIGYHLGDRDTAGVPSDWGNYILRGRADHEYTLTQLEEMDAMSTRWQVHGNRWLGDVNGDGLSDMVSFVKTQWREWNDAGQPTSPGYIDIRYGEPGGISRDPSVSIPWKVPTRDDSTRWEMPLYGGVGDVNGDGYDDMCIIDGEDLELFEGSAQGIALSPSSTTVLETPEDAHDRWTWYRDLRHGDVNGDGHSDIVIGDIAGPWLTVYYGSADGVDGTPHSTDFIRYNNNIGIHSPVDVNGDGYDDVVIELSGRDSAGYHLEIEVFEGSPEGLPSNASKRFGILHGEFFHFFRNILFADINGDSLDDILYEHENTGNWTRDEETKNLTRYSVYINTGGAYPAAPHYEFEIEGHFESYAWSRHGLNAVGDFDGDGLEDVAFGIPDGTAYSWDPHTDPIRPGHVLIIHGGGIMQRISDITVIGKTTLYAAHSEGEIVANLVPLEGQGAILGASITLDPGGADVTIEWDPTASGNPFRIIEDHLGCIGLNSTAEDVETDAATGAPRPHFRFVPGWEWPHEGPCTVALTIETETGQVGPLPSPGLFNVVTTVEFQGPPTIRGHGNRLIEDGDWVRAGEQVNMTDLVLVYSGSDDIEANLSGSMMATDNDGDASERPLGPNWLWHLSFFMDNETDKDEVLTISAKNLTGNAELKEVLTVRLPVDGDLPTIGNPVPDDQDWHAIFSVLISITASDTNGSGVEPLSLEYSWRTRNASAWSDWSREGLVVSTQGDQAEGLVTLQLRNGDENQVRWRARDLVGNGPAEVLQTIKVDTLNVSFADPFPDPDEWSLETTVSCGATITDLEGSGIDITTVQYRVSPRNLSQYGEWTDWDEGDIGDGRSVSTRVDVDLANSGRNYVQWRAMDIAGNGYTTSPHYRVRVDVTAPVFEEFSPGPDEFQTHTDVDCEVVVHDNALGSGVDLSSVQYRYSLNGSTPHWSDWTDAGMTGVADSARFSVVLAFSHGADNRVQFRCSDVAGNGPVESDEYHVAVDIEPPVILWIEPAEDEKQPGVTVNVRMAVRDDLSGFGPDSILCAYGTDGTVPTIPEYPLDDVEHDNGTLIGSTWLDLAPGVDNVVRFWVYDVVGNEAVSDVVSIWVNRPPVAVITSPSNGTTIWDTEELILKGGNSTDPDGDPLDYTWLLEGSPLANGEVADLSLEPGSYNITLVVSDDDGAEGRATVTVTVEEWVQPHTSEEPFDDWLLLLFLLVLVLTIVGALIWRTRVTERQGG